MLGKLVKNELKSYRFSMGIVFLAGLVFTIFMKIICMLPYREEIREVIQIIGFYGYYYMIMLVGVAAQVLVIIRFYSTMIGDRGYLTWTLPAKSSTILWSKIIGGGLWELLAAVVTYVYLAIFFAGNYWVYNFIDDELMWMLQDIADAFKPEYLITVILAVAAILLWSVVPLLLIYLCMAIGQLFGKWRILASIGCYFILMILLEIVLIVGIVLVAGAAVAVSPSPYVADISGFAFLNGLFGVLDVIGVAGFAALFAITNFIFKRHLNLE